MRLDDLVPDPSEVEPMDPEEFADAFMYGMTLSSGEIPDQMRSPTDFKFKTDEGNMNLTDVPMNRFGLAIAKKFRGDDKKGKTFMWRWFALTDVMDSPDAPSELFREVDGQREMHAAVLHAAAVAPLRKELRFEPQEFWDRAVQIAQDFEEPGSNRI